MNTDRNNNKSMEGYLHLLDEPLKNITKTEEMLVNMIKDRKGSVEFAVGNKDFNFSRETQTIVSFNEIE